MPRQLRPPRVHRDKKGRRYIFHKDRRYYAPKNMADRELIKIMFEVIRELNATNRRRRKRSGNKTKEKAKPYIREGHPAIVTSHEILENIGKDLEKKDLIAASKALVYHKLPDKNPAKPTLDPTTARLLDIVTGSAKRPALPSSAYQPIDLQPGSPKRSAPPTPIKKSKVKPYSYLKVGEQKIPLTEEQIANFQATINEAPELQRKAEEAEKKRESAEGDRQRLLTEQEEEKRARLAERRETGLDILKDKLSTEGKKIIARSSGVIKKPQSTTAHSVLKTLESDDPIAYNVLADLASKFTVKTSKSDIDEILRNRFEPQYREAKAQADQEARRASIERHTIAASPRKKPTLPPPDLSFDDINALAAELDSDGSEIGEGIGAATGGLYNTQIETIMNPNRKYGFKGVFPADMITKIPVTKSDPVVSFIMNLDPHDKPGSHWIAVFISRRDSTLEYYDSFGRDPSPAFTQQIKTVIDRLKTANYLQFKVNRIVDQSVTSSNCGWFAIKFLQDRYDGLPFKEATPYNRSKIGEANIEQFKKKYPPFKYI